jgi:hypothetical protein
MGLAKYILRIRVVGSPSFPAAFRLALLIPPTDVVQEANAPAEAARNPLRDSGAIMDGPPKVEWE